MSQRLPTDFSIDPYSTSGIELAEILNRLQGALDSMNSGTAAPSYAQLGTMWIDTTNIGDTPSTVDIMVGDGTGSVIVGTLNITDGVYTPANIASPGIDDQATGVQLTIQDALTSIGNPLNVAGDITASTGDVTASTGDIVASAGDVAANAGNFVAGTNGKGVDFNGSSILNDYEEGTWTPSLHANSTPTPLSQAVGTYIKIGNKVHCKCTFTLSSNTMANSPTFVDGLPFSPVNLNSSEACANVGRASNLALGSAGYSITGIVAAGVARIPMRTWKVATGVGNMNGSEWGTASQTSMEVTYYTA